MSIRKIAIIGEPMLHQRASEVDPKDIPTEDLQSLIRDMLETMVAADGVGIAAPQVGVGLRVFIARSPQGPVAVINPAITGRSWRQTKGEEGCLSVPGKFGSVKRHRSVRVKALDHEGRPMEFEARDFFARIIQHENDHLDGILFVDRIRQQGGKPPV